MAWSDLTFTGCAVLTSGQMTALQANFAALAQGAAGAPPLAPTSLMWTGQASGGALEVASAFTRGGAPALSIVQQVLASRYSTQSNCTTTFSSYLVGSMTPVFGDSTILVEADFTAILQAGTANGETSRVNLCRAPNGAPAVLTNSAAGAMDGFGVNLSISQGFTGSVHLMAVDSSRSGPTQYGIRFAALQANTSEVRATNGRLRILELR